MDQVTPGDRIRLQLDVYAKALAALREAVDTDTGDKKSRDSVLLSYVFTFEMAVRSLTVVLQARGLNPPDYAAAVLRAAFQARLIADADLWTRIREGRNDISHAYAEDKAIVLAGFVARDALGALTDLLERLRRGED
jgi:nucleotidyltransferase substrate binding protein (TIGR01987 family)